MGERREGQGMGGKECIPENLLLGLVFVLLLQVPMQPSKKKIRTRTIFIPFLILPVNFFSQEGI